MAKAKKAAKASSVQVVLASRIKEVARAANVRVSGDFVDAANAAVVASIKQAIARAKANGRQTIRPQDI
jgi:histone H3/H4